MGCGAERQAGVDGRETAKMEEDRRLIQWADTLLAACPEMSIKAAESAAQRAEQDKSRCEQVAQWTGNGMEDIRWILEGKDYPRLWWEATPGN